MIDVNNPKIKNILLNMHNVATKRMRKDVNEEILRENRVFDCLCGNISYGPNQCASFLNDKYGYNLSVDDIIRIFRQRYIAHPDEREAILKWAENLVKLLAEAIKGNKESFDNFETMRRKSPGHHKFREGERILAIMIYNRYPELNVYDDQSILMGLGRSLSTYFLYDFSDAVAYGNGFPTYKERNAANNDGNAAKAKENNNKGNNAKAQDNKNEKKLSYEEAIQRLHHLENTLDRTNALLQELQDEFEEQINVSKVQEMTEFFSRLNSDKYGCILDELLVANKGINNLKRRNYELPIEINGLLIMVRKLIQFVRDSRINPIMKVDSVKNVKASDVEFCNYDGSPFSNENELKKVRVISPGWVYKELQISSPKLKEEK